MPAAQFSLENWGDYSIMGKDKNGKDKNTTVRRASKYIDRIKMFDDKSWSEINAAAAEFMQKKKPVATAVAEDVEKEGMDSDEPLSEDDLNLASEI